MSDQLTWSTTKTEFTGINEVTSYSAIQSSWPCFQLSVSSSRRLFDTNEARTLLFLALYQDNRFPLLTSPASAQPAPEADKPHSESWSHRCGS
jgi:hypothetical protein